MKPRLIVVLGMHRSGTSLITRSLAAIGANFGNNLIPPQPDNDKGFWEDSDIIAFNDELLNSCGMTWYSTEPWHTKKVNPKTLKSYQERAINLLERKITTASILALKDPRISKLFEFWSSVFQRLNANILYVLAIRSPLSIAESLMNRDNIANYHAYILWADYNLAVLSHLGGKQFIRIEYEEMVNDSVTQVLKIADFTGLDIQEEQLENFSCNYVERQLEHNRFSHNETNNNNDLPFLCKKIYSYLVSKELERALFNIDKHNRFVSECKNTFSNLIDCQSHNFYIEDYYRDLMSARDEAIQARNEAMQARNEAMQARAEAAQFSSEINKIYSSRSWKFIRKLQKIKNLIAQN